MTVLELLTEALAEINVISPGEAPSAEDSELALSTFNELMDSWNADRRAVYVDAISTHTLTPALQPHTIGSAGATFTVSSRPVSIEDANLVISDVRYPIALRDKYWWMALPDRTLTGAIPTDLYYEQAWPNGNLYLWPVPTTAYMLELLKRALLSSVALSDIFTMPPGYKAAVKLSLAEAFCGPFERSVPPKLGERATKARAVIFGNNDPDPHMVVADYGMPSMAARGTFDYRIGRAR